MMKKIYSLFVLGLALAAVAAEPINPPELMRCQDGTLVTTVAQWENKRRPEILEIFRREFYGRRPVERPEGLRFEKVGEDVPFLDGKAVMRKVRISWKGKLKDGSFVARAFLPAKIDTPRAAFLFCQLRPWAKSRYNVNYDKPANWDFFPAEDIVNRGFVGVMFNVHDVWPDDQKVDFGKVGLFSCYSSNWKNRGPEEWGATSGWGWAASRVLDWLETVKEVDAKHVAVVGHSRGGKTAMWAAAEDRRFAMACINDSGEMGVKLHHMILPGSCPIKVCGTTDYHKFWFAGNLARWSGKDLTIPFDQHWAVALIAPRPVCIASASKDVWAGPEGEYWAARLASPAWEVFGKKGLVTTGFPKPGEDQQQGMVSYHLRPGEHLITAYDWKRYLDVAERQGWPRK